jgi:hypothetical protein
MVLGRGPTAAAAVIVAGACAALAVPACNAGVTPAAAYDEPLFTFQANLTGGDALAGATNPTFGVVWTDPLQRRPDVVMPAGWADSEVPRGSLQAFDTRLYRPPPPEAIVAVNGPSGDKAELAFGEIVIFDDLDADGTFTVSGPHAEIESKDKDNYLAGSFQVLVYVARPFSTLDITFPIFSSNFTGYALIDYACNGQVSLRTSERALANFVMQPSQRLPEIRHCRRTHSP